MIKKEITRRDFINGVLVAAGTATAGSIMGTSLLSGCSHFKKSKKYPAHQIPGSDINRDPRIMRGGNLPAAFLIGHWMRDQRLSFRPYSVHLAAGIGDSMEGDFPIVDDSYRPDVVIVGSGMSGLSSAFYLSRRNPKMRILILDANTTLGGNAAEDNSPPLPMSASTGAAYAVSPYADFLKEIYKETGVDWESHLVQSPFYNYFFDEHTPYIQPNTRRWVMDVYGDGLKGMPYSPQLLKDFEAARKDFLQWYDVEGGPTDPPDKSHPKYDHLDSITFHDYLTRKKGYHPAVSDFYTRFTIDALAGKTTQVSAYSAINFLGAEYHPLFAFPGGNAGIAQHIAQWLLKDDSLKTPALDQPTGRVRIRQEAVMLRADTTSKHASVTYFKDGKMRRVTANAVIIATQAHSAQHAVEHLIDAETRSAMKATTLVPVVVANVTLRRAAPLIDLGLGYNQYWWGSKYWADFVIADWVTSDRNRRDRETVLTFYGGNTAAPEEIPGERMKVFTTPFSSYEESIREDLTRVLAGSDFNFDEDVSAIYLYRWGHGMVYPKPGSIFKAAPDASSRSSSRSGVRHLARQPIERIFFAGQDTEGTPSLEAAIGSGLRSSDEVMRKMTSG